MKIGIIGGGVTGLALAWELRRSGHEILLFERGGLGGLAGGFRFPLRPSVYLEKYYHHIFRSDAEIIGLIHDLGLGGDLLWLPSRTGLYASGRVWPFQSPLDLLRFQPIPSAWQRVLMGLNLLDLKHRRRYEPLNTLTCRRFFASRFNTPAFERLWLPLLHQKFGERKEEIPASFLWGRVSPRTSSRQNGAEVLGYLRGGFPRLFRAMAGRLAEDGVRLHTGTTVRRIHPGPTVGLETTAGRLDLDKLVWTAPSRRLKGVIAPGAPQSRPLPDLEHIAVTCLVLVLKKRLGPYYWVNNLDLDLSFGGLIEHTNLVPPEEYGGRHILYVVNYHAQSSPLFRMGSSRLLEHHRPSLARVYGDRFRAGDVAAAYAFHALDSSPLYDLDYHARMPGYDQAWQGVHVCGMEQVYPHDRNMNRCVVNARRFLASRSWT